ncbi:hypothetical protein MY5147_008504 [Beauveria neobassiana]|uniref:Uncharacterized protein n=2 Tax=Beauveria bassiana TaxID=176275 RepID=A0A0A2W2J1_BEABA|nr:hypothetical protein BBAD15_g1616 [Beauveria bassiana D1-5]PQK12577.1 hypothetical protein BB8028_0003g11940 [Beauveria bassiana]
MSAKPTLHISMPPRRLSDYPGPRSPRFREDFDAPFSEAIMNASHYTVASPGSFSSSSQGRASLDDSIRRCSPGSSMRTPSFPAQSPTEPWREFPWGQKTTATSTTMRKPSVNHRVRGWARRSLIFKSRPTSPDEPAEGSFSKVDHSAEAATTESRK